MFTTQVGEPQYDLHRLGWHEFQDLCHTVAREVLGQTIEKFLDVRDGGRDGAFVGEWKAQGAETWTGRFVFQCKHTSQIGRNLTLKDLEDEIQKAERLVDAGLCDVYILLTNLGVSGRTAEEVVTALKAVGVRDVAVFGRTWMNQTIVESSRLRMLVPRLYGLGDLTQILDERAYDQAAAVLEAMRSDLNKLVRTGTYETAAQALFERRFVLLLGQPATGKTTIAAELALAAIDGHGAAVVKIDDAADFEDRWNPVEPSQLFWLDDAFGSTQLDTGLAKHWARVVPRVQAALERGTRIVLTSRDYIYEAAKPYLKPGAFPLLDESQVVVDVRDLTGQERRQILYNHLQHGSQPAGFLAAAQSHLETLADHPGFTPELARRLAHPSFTTKVIPGVKESLEAFFARPREYLEDVIRGLDDDAKAALGLIYVNRNRLHSPLELTQLDSDLVARIGSDLGGVTKALHAMGDSLVTLTKTERQVVWSFAHPTMSDAYARLLESPEFLPHLASGFPLAVLLRQTTCGDVGIENAIVLPPSAYPIVLDRLDEPLEGDWESQQEDRRRRMSYLSSRVDRTFLGAYVERKPELLDRISRPGMMLDAVPEVDVAVRLWREHLLPEEIRAQFADAVIKYCVTGQDPGLLLIDGMREMLTPEEDEAFRSQMKEELLPALRDVLADWESAYGDYLDPPEPYEHMRPLEDLLRSRCTRPSGW